jgi:hypothetical protein
LCTNHHIAVIPSEYDDIVIEYIQSHIFPQLATDFKLDQAQATDENLTGENWELILNLCDKVQEE